VKVHVTLIQADILLCAVERIVPVESCPQMAAGVLEDCLHQLFVNAVQV